MKKFFLIIFVIFLLLTFFISAIYITRYYDQKNIKDNFYYNCEYWSKNYRDNESDPANINFILLTIKKCKLNNQNKFLLKNIDNTAISGTDFLSGKSVHINETVLSTLRELYNQDKTTEEWKDFLLKNN